MATFERFFSLDSPKAIKAREYGWLNAINYMAPAATGGAGNLCPHASAGCLALCLGWFSGQAGIVKKGTGRRAGANKARQSRIAKVRMFMHDRKAFMREMFEGVQRAYRKAIREGLKLCVRPNGATDIPWEHIKVDGWKSIIECFSNVQFVDYTKSVKRMLRFCAGELPRNYHLTFSRSETNEADCRRVLAAGGNVAVVFAETFPATYLGYPVINGDRHDLRHLDARNVIVGLSPKGPRAKHDASGFVVRS